MICGHRWRLLLPVLIEVRHRLRWTFDLRFGGDRLLTVRPLNLTLTGLKFNVTGTFRKKFKNE